MRHYRKLSEKITIEDDKASYDSERGGYIKFEHGSLKVTLKRFKNHEINYAAGHLCEQLNSMNPQTLDRFKLPMKYEIQ